MANLDFYTTPLDVNDTKIFGAADTAAHFAKVAGDNASLQRILSALQRGPVHFYRNNVIALDEDVADYLLFVVTGVVRSCKICKKGTRSVVSFYLPGDFFGWVDAKLSLSIEAARYGGAVYQAQGLGCSRVAGRASCKRFTDSGNQ
jgi:hypothetical protein